MESNKNQALIQAIKAKKSDDEIKKLISKDESVVNSVDEHHSKMTALMWAIQFERVEISKLLIDKGADYTAESNNGWTVLMWAAHRGNVEIIGHLLEEGADIYEQPKNCRYMTALMRAVINCQVEAVKFLISKGACVNAVNDYCKTALDYAEKRKYQELIDAVKGTEAKK